MPSKQKGIKMDKARKFTRVAASDEMCQVCETEAAVLVLLGPVNCCTCGNEIRLCGDCGNDLFMEVERHVL